MIPKEEQRNIFTNLKFRHVTSSNGSDKPLSVLTGTVNGLEHFNTIKIGNKFELKDKFTKDDNLIVIYKNATYSNEKGGMVTCDFACTKNGVPYPPATKNDLFSEAGIEPPKIKEPKIYGFEYATVVDAKEDNYGQKKDGNNGEKLVKIRFDYGNENDEYNCCFALIDPDFWNNYGFPKKDWIVIVEFEKGDPAKPKVVGLHPKYNSLKIGQRSLPVPLPDSHEKTHVQILTEDGDNQKAEIKYTGKVETSYGGDCLMNAIGNMEFTSDKNVVTKASNGKVTTKAVDVETEATQGIKQQGRTVDVDAELEAKFKGASTEVGGSGVTQVKGGLVKEG